MKLWKKKYYKEVPCKACDGMGAKTGLKFASISGVNPDKVLELAQGICQGCKGKGTQTVFEREE